MFDPENLFAGAIEQLQSAAGQIKQKYLTEATLWQKKAEELQAYVDSLESQLRAAQQANLQIKASLADVTAEIENLRTVNETLTRSLREKEDAVNRYQSLNRSLKGLLDDTPDAPPLANLTPKRSPRSPPSLEGSPGRTDSPGRMDSPGRTDSLGRTASPGSLFMKAAKEELTYSDFNQMISEINRYNRHEQSREDVIANVKKFLCPAHRGLFEQLLPIIGN
jgi:hypothetical protein